MGGQRTARSEVASRAAEATLMRLRISRGTKGVLRKKMRVSSLHC